MWIASARKPGSAHALELDLNSSNCRFSRKLQHNLSRQKVEIGIMRVSAVQEDCCGHGDSRPGPRSLGIGLGIPLSILVGGDRFGSVDRVATRIDPAM